MKRLNKKLFLFFYILGLVSLFSQEKKLTTLAFNPNDYHDSLVYKVLSLKNKFVTKYNLAYYIPNNKCGLSIQVEYQKKKQLLSETDRNIIHQFFLRVEKDTSILSKNKNFRIHFDKSGDDSPDMTDKDNNGVPDFIDSVAYYFEYALDKLVNSLGYEGLVSDNNAGGGNEYDIYVENLSSGTYGYTTFEDRLTNENEVPRFSSYITIDNNFSDLYTSGINGLKITAAHELFHAIQIGKYGIWMDDVYYYEILSTWIETYLFENVKDYYQYLNSFFAATTKPFWKHSGYDLTIWALFLTQKYSPSIMKSILENFKTIPPLKATERVLNSFDKTLLSEYSEFSNWVYFTSYRAKKGYYFLEAENYPQVSGSSLKLINYISPSCNINSSLQSLSTQYFNIFYKNDTISLITSKVDINEVYDKSDNYAYSTYTISEYKNSDKQIMFPNGLNITFNADNTSIWKTFYLLNNNFLLDNDNIKIFPSPAYITDNSNIYFSVPNPIGDEFELFIFSSDLRLIFQDKRIVSPILGGNGFNWNCIDKNGNKISSGIYFYFLKSSGKEYKGKLSVVRK